MSAGIMRIAMGMEKNDAVTGALGKGTLEVEDPEVEDPGRRYLRGRGSRG